MYYPLVPAHPADLEREEEEYKDYSEFLDASAPGGQLCSNGGQSLSYKIAVNVAVKACPHDTIFCIAYGGSCLATCTTSKLQMMQGNTTPNSEHPCS